MYFFHRVMGARFLHSVPGFDEHYFLWEGFSLSRGMVPYRDFQEFKPPVIFLVNALGLKLFGLQEMAYRNVFSILALCAFLTFAIALLSRRTSRLFVAGLVALMISHFYYSGFHDSGIDDAESIGLFFFMIGTSVLLVRTRFERTQQVMGGAILSLAPLTKEPLAFATVGAWLALLLLCHFESPRFHAGLRFALFTVAGVAGVAVVWLGYMLATHSLGWYQLQLQLSFAYTKSYAVQIGWFPKDPAKGVFDESWKRLRESYVNYDRLAPFVPLFVAPLFLWGRRFLVGCAALLAFAGGVYAVTIGHGFRLHYFILAMTGTFFAAAICAVALEDYARRFGNGLRGWLGASWTGLALLALWSQYAAEKDAKYTSPPPAVSAAELAFVQSHSSRADKIWTTGDPLLYVYSDRLAALREGNAIDELLEYLPGNTDEERLAGEREELAQSMPKLVIFGDDAQPSYRKQRTMRALVMPFLHDFGYTQVSDKFWVRP